jgi:hypothetical protein
MAIAKEALRYFERFMMASRTMLNRLADHRPSRRKELFCARLDR